MLADIILWLPPILFAITIHEVAHGLMADYQGDPTAKYAGRLTLNPLPHIDPIGFIALVIFHIGWAKPVPVNPAMFKNPRRGILLVSLAGPVSNILLAIASSLLFRLFMLLVTTPNPVVRTIVLMLRISVEINLILAFFNLIPIPPLDGSKVLFNLMNVSAEGQLRLERIGPLLLIFVIFTGGIRFLIFPLVNLFRGILIGI